MFGGGAGALVGGIVVARWAAYDMLWLLLLLRRRRRERRLLLLLLLLLLLQVMTSHIRSKDFVRGMVLPFVGVSVKRWAGVRGLPSGDAGAERRGGRGIADACI